MKNPPTLIAVAAVAAIAACLAAATRAQEPRDTEPDPTRASPRLRAALLDEGTAIPDIVVRGIVIGAARDGGSVALEAAGGGIHLARPGIPFTLTAGGLLRKLVVSRVAVEGIEIEAPESGESITLPGPRMMPGAGGGGGRGVDYVEFRELPLIDALRLLSDQTGRNFSSSAEANKLLVNAFLRGVPADAVVEELCKSHNLWFRSDERSGILRIMTMSEFEKDLAGFREERTEVYTLRYPNVTEIAVAIADLFGDRVRLSLGAEETDDDMRRDLEGRFDRFDILTQRTQYAGMLQGQSANIIGGNVNGFYSGGGGLYGFGGMGGMGGMGGYGTTGRGGGRWDDDYGRLRQDGRFRRGDDGTALPAEGGFRGLTPEQAQRVERALAGGAAPGEAAAVEDLRTKPATIFITGSRRNNMLVVRTADSRSLDDIRALVRRMDVPTPLVLLEVKVVSIELGTDFRSAFDYQFSDGDTSATFSRENVPRPPDGGAMLSGGINSSDMTFVLVDDNFRARVQLFEQKNRIKNIATPTLLTANNEVSRLFLGEERPLVRGINSQTIITDNNVATTPNTVTEFRPVGNTLLITPNINSDRTVTIRLVQEHSFINPAGASIPVVTSTENGSSVQDVKVDVVATRSISGTFVAKDGMTVAAGGLIEEIDSTKRGQVPLLGDIPLLGVLFRRDEITKSRRELVVIIKPHVMSTPADGQRISEEVLLRLAPESADLLTGEGLLSGAALFPDRAEEPPPPARAGSGGAKNPGKSGSRR